MDVMRNLFAAVTSGVIRLLVTVGIIAAVGFFIVKPALDSTNEAIDSVSRGFNQGAGQGNVDDLIQQQIRKSNQQVRQSVHQAQQNLHQQNGLSLSQQQTIRKQKRLLACIQRANGKVGRIQRCANRFQ